MINFINMNWEIFLLQDSKWEKWKTRNYQGSCLWSDRSHTHLGVVSLCQYFYFPGLVNMMDSNLTVTFYYITHGDLALQNVSFVWLWQEEKIRTSRKGRKEASASLCAGKWRGLPPGLQIRAKSMWHHIYVCSASSRDPHTLASLLSWT